MILGFMFCFENLKFNTSKFIVSKKKTKKLSKNRLKESIGHELKDILDNCAEASKQLGILQVKIAQIQKGLLPKIENLVSNEKPFKKASRNDLQKTFNLTQNIASKLKEQVVTVNEMKSQINNDGRLG